MDIVDFPILQLVGSTIHGLSLLVLVIGTVLLYLRRRDLGSGLMLLGSIGVVLTYVVSYLGMILVSRSGAEGLFRLQGIISVLSGLSYLILAGGVIILGLQHSRKVTDVTSESNR